MRSTKYVSVLNAAVRVTELSADGDVVVDMEMEVKNVVGTARVLLVGLVDAEAVAAVSTDVLVGCGFCCDVTDAPPN